MRTIIRFAFISCLLLPIHAQRLSFGLVGGTNLTSNFPGVDTTSPADSSGNPANRFQFLTGDRAFIFGALLEGRITDRLAIEANVLHRPLKELITFAEFPATGPSVQFQNRRTAVRTWEFPVMLKYNLPSFGRLKPFIEAGPSIRTQEDASAVEPSRFGLTAGAGAAIHFGRLRVAPTLRYTRWQRENIYPRYPTKPDQLEFLTSFSFETNTGSRRVLGRKIEIGALFGLPLTRGFYQSPAVRKFHESFPIMAGLAAQIPLFRHYSLEVDGIYKPLRGERSDPSGTFAVLTWQVPVLAKYTWSKSKWSPFVVAGPSFRLSGNLNGYDPSIFGVTAGAGLETRAHNLRVSPSLRYTRWTRDANPYGNARSFVGPRTNQNSVELVFGISF